MVHYPVIDALEFAQGPVFRGAFALLVLGVLRRWILVVSDVAAAYVSVANRGSFWTKVRWRIGWALFPMVVLRRRYPASPLRTAHHFSLCGLSMLLRIGAVLLPAFMLSHVVLIERTLGVSWPALPGGVADVLALITIVAGVLLFLGRLYSPTVRKIEPAWSFFKPLILILPFLTGYIAMHPHRSPLDYHFIMLLHVLSACVVFVMIPFGRLLSCMHRDITAVIPEAAWEPHPADAEDEPPPNNVVTP